MVTRIMAAHAAAIAAVGTHKLKRAETVIGSWLGSRDATAGHRLRGRGDNDSAAHVCRDSRLAVMPERYSRHSEHSVKCDSSSADATGSTASPPAFNAISDWA